MINTDTKDGMITTQVDGRNDQLLLEILAGVIGVINGIENTLLRMGYYHDLMTCLSNRDFTEMVDLDVVRLSKMKADKADINNMRKGTTAIAEYAKVVRCKDCKFKNTKNCTMIHSFTNSNGNTVMSAIDINDNDFCSSGVKNND